MNDSDVKIGELLTLSSLTKLEIYRAIANFVTKNMRLGKMEPERSHEILEYLKVELVKVKTTEAAKQFCKDMVVKFKELEGVKQEFDIKEAEEIHENLVGLADRVIEQNDIEAAHELIEGILGFEEDQDFQKLELLIKKFELG